VIEIVQRAYRIEMHWRLGTRWRTSWTEMVGWAWIGALDGAS